MKVLWRLLILASASIFASASLADSWPSRPIRAVVPVAAGSSTDIVPRVVFEQLASQLGQSIVVENRAGAGGTMGSAHVAKSLPDGYTVLAHGSAHTIAPSLYSNLGYDPSRDFIPVVPLGVTPSVLVVAPSTGYRSVADLIAASKARPGGLNFSSVGVGSATHLSAARFCSSTGISAVHVPFKGGAEAMTEAITGRVDFFFGPVALVLPHIRDGKLVALAVNGITRSAVLPDVPTLQEAGVANAEYPIWFGLFVPAHTPADVVDRLHRETRSALQTAKVRDKLLSLGVDPMPMTLGEFEAHVRKEVALNAALVQMVGIKPE